MSILLEKQSRFARLIAELVLWIFERGWSVTLGEGSVTELRAVRRDKADAPTVFYRDAVHRLNSLHYSRLAQDLNLFVDGEYVTGSNPAWDEIGARWKAMDPLCRWGGDFGDYNHFSLVANPEDKRK